MYTDNHKLAAIVLAAGQSQRFGAPKQLADVRGKPMINHVIGQLPLPNKKIYAVLGAHADKIKRVVNRQISIIDNPQWQSGMSQSIIAAVSYIDEELKGQCDRVLVALVDQVQVNKDDFLRLIDASDRHKEKIVVATFNQTYGAPVIFPKAFFNDLLHVKGDSGAKKIIEQNIANTVFIEMESAAMDIDTHEQLVNVLKS